MKTLWLIVFSCLTLTAADISNAGKPKNAFGYYGEGVVFGGYDIVGEWRVCSKDAIRFDQNGSLDGSSEEYGVSEDGNELLFGRYSLFVVTRTEEGDFGCSGIIFTFVPNDFGSEYSQTCVACKVNIKSKTYGAASNPIVVSVDTR